jgi:membrane protein
MFWKFVFALYSLALFGINLKFAMGESTNSSLNISETLGLITIGVFIFGFSVFALFYTLAAKLKTCSKKFINISLTALVLTNILTPMAIMLNNESVRNTTTEQIAALLTFIICTILFFIVLSPVYFAFYRLYKNYSFYTEANNRFFNIFALFSLICFYIPYFIANLYEAFTDFAGTTSWDILTILCYIYSIIFLTGITFDKRILPKLFWQISALPFVIAYIWPEKNDWANIFQDFKVFPVSVNVFIVIMFILFFVMLYKYAFTKEYDKKEEVIL